MLEDPSEDAEYFQSIVLSSPDCIRILDLEGRFEFMNPSGRRMLGLDDVRLQHVAGRPWPELWPEAERPVIEQALAGAKAGETRRFRAFFHRPDGFSRWLDTTVSPVYRDGAVRRILALSRDITEEVETRTLMNTILDCVPAALFAKEVETSRLVFLNQHAEELFGHKAAQMVGKTAYDFVTPSQADAIRAADLQAAASARTIVIEDETVTQLDGRTHVRRTRKKATPGPGVRYIVCLTEDVSEEHARKAALEQALKEAEAADLAKSQFLAVMSHEIRSPLNGVLGMAQAMAMAELSADQRQRLQVIREAGQVLLDLLNDMLDLSRINAGKLQIEDGLVDGHDLGRAARNLFDGLAVDKDLSFELDMPGAAAGPWRGDPTRVRQIVTNLIGNAVKFTEQGRVRLTLEAEAGGLLIQVADTGPGIPPEKLARIFDPFDQLDPSNTRRHGGSGLGLAICRSLAEAMGGRIEVRSAVGEGSVFSLRLPLERLQGPPAALGDCGLAELLATPVCERPLRILAAEDNPMNQLVLRTLLDAVGLEVELVSNGQEAVEAWRREPWDLILMDVQMPVMDGPDAAFAIRALEERRDRPRTPIVALTANAMKHQLDTYSACGMDAVVSKPIEVRALVEAIRALTASPDQAAPSRAAEA